MPMQMWNWGERHEFGCCVEKVAIIQTKSNERLWVVSKWMVWIGLVLVRPQNLTSYLISAGQECVRKRNLSRNPQQFTLAFDSKRDPIYFQLNSGLWRNSPTKHLQHLMFHENISIYDCIAVLVICIPNSRFLIMNPNYCEICWRSPTALPLNWLHSNLLLYSQCVHKISLSIKCFLLPNTRVYF